MPATRHPCWTVLQLRIQALSPQMRIAETAPMALFLLAETQGHWTVCTKTGWTCFIEGGHVIQHSAIHAHHPATLS